MVVRCTRNTSTKTSIAAKIVCLPKAFTFNEYSSSIHYSLLQRQYIKYYNTSIITSYIIYVSSNNAIFIYPT